LFVQPDSGVTWFGWKKGPKTFKILQMLPISMSIVQLKWISRGHLSL
jgi:hypothetical protein